MEEIEEGNRSKDLTNHTCLWERQCEDKKLQKRVVVLTAQLVNGFPVDEECLLLISLFLDYVCPLILSLKHIKI